GEQADRLRANLRYTAGAIDVMDAEAEAGPANVRFRGSYQHREDDWKNGDVRFDVATQGTQISRIETLKKLEPQLDAKVDAKAAGAARVLNGRLSLTSLNGEAAARGVTFSGETLGDVSLTAAMQGAELSLRGTAQVRD